MSLGFEISLGSKGVLRSVSICPQGNCISQDHSKKQKSLPRLFQWRDLIRGIIAELRAGLRAPSRILSTWDINNKRKSLLSLWLQKQGEEIVLSEYSGDWNHRGGSARQGLYFSSCQRQAAKGREWRWNILNISPPALSSSASVSHWLNQPESRKVAVPRDQPSEAQSKAEKRMARVEDKQTNKQKNSITSKIQQSPRESKKLWRVSQAVFKFFETSAKKTLSCTYWRKRPHLWTESTWRCWPDPWKQTVIKSSLLVAEFRAQALWEHWTNKELNEDTCRHTSGTF